MSPAEAASGLALVLAGGGPPSLQYPSGLRRRLGRILQQLLNEPIVPPQPRGSSSCVVCQRPIIRSLGRDVRVTCSAACLRAFRAELARDTVLSPEAQARSAASARRRVATPEQRAAWRAQIRAARRQARPLLAELQAIERARLDVLAPDEREVLARYYGLDGRVPRTLTEVARELRVSKFRAAQQVRRAVALLLGAAGGTGRAGWTGERALRRLRRARRAVAEPGRQGA